MARPRQTPTAVREKGQHFLPGDSSIVRRMMESAAIQPGQRVLDVGAGSGSFTDLLAEAVGQHGHVTAVELQPRLAKRLAERVGNNTQVIAGDVLTVELAGPYDAVVANPPYRIIPPMLARLLDDGFGRAVLVMPRELVERLTARPGSGAYGRLSIEMAMRSATEFLFHIPRRAFDPPPAVASSVARITPLTIPLLDPEGRAKLDKILDVVFEQRHRTNRYAFAPVAGMFRLATEKVTAIMKEMGIWEKTPLMTSPEEYAAFVRALGTSGTSAS